MCSGNAPHGKRRSADPTFNSGRHSDGSLASPSPTFRRTTLPSLIPYGFGRHHSSRGDARTHVTGLSEPLPEDLQPWSDRPLVTHLKDADTAKGAAGELAERLAVQLCPSPANRIFCNRSLNMQHIDAVGFDMDYTLAMYKPETFEVLAYTLTCEKLVNVYGYPTEVLRYEYDHEYMVRGLVVDKKRGNILKMDRHKYVKGE